MRLLHTSDWHLGQNFFTQNRKAEHQAFTQWLIQQVEDRNIDAVVIAGDVFDTGTPPSYARELYNQFIVNLNKVGCQLVVLGGNHDSVSTLNESKQLLAQLNTQVIASTSSEPSEQVVELIRENEVIGLVCAIPFVRARDVMSSQAGESGVEKQQALGKAIAEHYHLVYQHAFKRREELGKDIPIIATGHLTALGVKTSESVRDIYIGTLDGFDANGFPPADYIALGHIHRPQIVAKQDHIRYCGSPIPLSFDELKWQKQVIMVEFDGINPTIEPIEIPRFQAMAAIKGDLESIEKQLSELDFERSEGLWLSIEVETQDYLTDLQERVQVLLEGTCWEVVQLRRAKGVRNHTMQTQEKVELSELTPFEVFEKRLDLEAFDSDELKQRKQRITTTFNQIVEGVELEASPQTQHIEGEK